MPEVLEKPKSFERLTGRTLKPGKPGRPVKSKPETGIMSPEFQTLKVSCVVKTKNLISADFVWIAWWGLRMTTINDKEVIRIF